MLLNSSLTYLLKYFRNCLGKNCVVENCSKTFIIASTGFFSTTHLVLYANYSNFYLCYILV